MKNMSEQMNSGLSGNQKGKTVSALGRSPSVPYHVPDLSSFALHVLAMLLMLCDHLWATLLPQYAMLTHIGRIAFPIFAFLLAEGARHTHDPKKYLLRLLIFAVLSEIPFDLMYGGTVFYPYHQNVLWTFLIALSGVFLVQSIEKRLRHRWMAAPLWAACIFICYALGTLGMTDYYGFGVLTVFLFILFPGAAWWQRLAQLAGLYWINCQGLSGELLSVTIFGRAVEFPEQGLALLALLPIWLYHGRQGYHSKAFQYICYGFYPVHMLLLSLILFLMQ